MPLRTSILNSGPFPPPALPGFDGTTGLSATPGGPACPSRESGWRSRAPPPGASRVASDLLCRHAVANTPVGPLVRVASRGVTPILPATCGLPRFSGGSAPTLPLSRPAQRSLTLRPACSRGRQGDPFHRRLRRFRCLHRRSDCYRLERPSCRAGFAPAEDPNLSTAHAKMCSKGGLSSRKTASMRGCITALLSGCDTTTQDIK